MPKHKKEKAGPGMRHQPLATQMAVDGKPQDKGKKTVVAGSKRSKRAAADRVRNAAAAGGGGDGDDDDDDGDGYLPPKMTKRILEQAREQG
ncbi:unnamed protein product, partial [Ectocarpus fasciculatus]